MTGPSKICLLLCLILLFAACSQPEQTATRPETPAALTAPELAQDALIVDTHIDVPYRLYRNPADVTKATEDGEFDLPRAQAGGLDAAFMSIYIPARVEDEGEGKAKAMALELITLTEGIAATAPAEIGMATCTSDVLALKAAGKLALPMGMENGAPMEGDLANVSFFHDKGIRYVTLAHSKSNHISDSSYDENEQWQGLSAFGKTLVPELNRYGVMIDISHLSDMAATQVLQMSATPVIASHSSLRHFVPGFHRNMTDEMVKALGENGGVLQINFGSGFISAASREWANNRTAAVRAFQAENKLPDGDDGLRVFAADWTDANPYPFANTDTVLDHIDRTVELAGIDHVGLGSDYDGVGDTLPEGLKDVSTYPNLVQGLMDRGYSEADIRKILGENLMRVWQANEVYAAEQGVQLKCTQSG